MAWSTVQSVVWHTLGFHTHIGFFFFSVSVFSVFFAVFSFSSKSSLARRHRLVSVSVAVFYFARSLPAVRVLTCPTSTAAAK